ncbi:MAG: CD225/dispanin family protein, partial [Acidimicrobiales bacterium]
GPQAAPQTGPQADQGQQPAGWDGGSPPEWVQSPGWGASPGWGTSPPGQSPPPAWGHAPAPGPAPGPAPSWGSPPQTGWGRPPTYLWAAIACLFFFLPTALVALTYSSRVTRLLALGDWRGAARSSRLARTWCLLSVLAGFLVFVLVATGALPTGSPNQFG